jgi:hypothetical protein
MLQAVGWGVDTLKASAIGALKPEVVTLLTALQQTALDERALHQHKGDVRVDTHWVLDGQPLLMTPYGGGKGQWTWILTCPAATFELGMGHLNGIGCQVRLSSSFLWEHGYRQAWALVQALLVPWFDTGTWFQVSEVHLCADIAGVLVDKLRDVDFVTRSQVTRWHKEDARILDIVAHQRKDADQPRLQLVQRYRQKETLTFSPRGGLEVQVYDKPREIRRKSPDKAWFGDIWEHNGWNREDPVARIEARLKRAVLHELGCETVAQTFDRLDALWQYITRKWLRHTVPNQQDSYLWPLSNLWQVVQGVTFEQVNVAPAPRDKVRNYREQQMLSAIMGYLESWAAWQSSTGKVPADIDVQGVFTQLHQRSQGHYQTKGISFRDAVIRKRKVLGITPGESPPGDDDGFAVAN